MRGGERRHRWMALLAVGLAGTVLLGDAVLAWRALAGAEAEGRRRHQVVAERLFDELERELTTLVSREEERSFLEYRYFYVPEQQVQGAAGLLRSPLSELPHDPQVVGYFQIDPDGTLFTPARPRDNELDLASQSEGFSASDRLEAAEAELRLLAARADWDAAPSASAAASAAAAAVAVAAGQKGKEAALSEVYDATVQSLNRYDATVQSLNRGVRDRQNKTALSIKTSGSNVANFTNSPQEQAWAPSAAASDRRATVPLTSLAGDVVDVVVSPIRGTAVAEPPRLLLHRTVRVGADTYRQGVALRPEALQQHLTQAVLTGGELAPYVRLWWGEAGPPGGSGWSGVGEGEGEGYVFVHRFASPFSSLSVTAEFSEIPGAGDGGQRAILGLSAVLALVTVAGAAALYGAVSAELEFAERRTNFVAAVSHELKTPLTAIRMYSEMLREGMVPTLERQHQYYDTITAESERLSRLINNVLELSRLERGTRSMALSAGAVGPLLEQTAEMLRPHVERQGMRLIVSVEADLPAVQVEADALSQILVNLVDNAVKFSQDSATREVRLWAARDGSGGVQVGVRDGGPGVPARQLRRIFEPFFRGERELTRRTQGTGIGLALVARLAGQMRARVVALNHPEGGLEVRLSLAPAQGRAG